jgi:hypothetical protein
MRTKKSKAVHRKSMKKTKPQSKPQYVQSSRLPSVLSYNHPNNADEENWKSSENRNEYSPPSGLGYRDAHNVVSSTVRIHKPAPAAEDEGFNANTEDNANENEMDIEDHVEHLIERHHGTEHGCSRMTLAERLNAVDTELSKVFESYNKLVHGIAEQTMADFLRSRSLKKSYSKKLKKWYKTASRRASIYQLTSEKDLTRAFLYLLPTFDSSKKFWILGTKEDKQSSMHDMIQKYAYKMVTALFTKANITYAVLNYTPVSSDPYQYLKNLMELMRDGHYMINHLFQTNWNQFLPESAIYFTRYVHSGGNLFVVLAGVLCYLFEHAAKDTYEPHMLDKIRKEFNDYLMAQDAFVSFYTDLKKKMDIPAFQQSLKDCTSQISDMDFVLMAPDEYVTHLDNPVLKRMNELSAYVLRQILVFAHRDTSDPEVQISKKLLPFTERFDERWRQSRSFFNMSGIRPASEASILAIGGTDYPGYRQISNIVPEIPIYLNRLKQGYPFFFEEKIAKKIPLEVQKEYYTKYGECLDLSMGVKSNELYSHKQDYFKQDRYYSISNLLEELMVILTRPRDDKTKKREDRRDFLIAINSIHYNALFYIIGQNISR